MALGDYPEYNSAYQKASDLAFRLNGAPGSLAGGLAAALDDFAAKYGEESVEYKRVKAQYDSVKKQYEAAEANRVKIKNKIELDEVKASIAEKKTKKAKELERNVKSLQSQLESANRRGDSAKVTELQKQIVDIEEAAKPKPLKKEVKGDGAEGGVSIEDVSLTDFLKSAIGSVEKTKQLQIALSEAGEYEGPIDGVFRADKLLKSAQAAEEKLAQYESLGITFKDRFEGYKRLKAGKTGGDGTGITATATVSNPTQAKAYINNVYQSLLGRDATPNEVATLTKKLNNAELKSKSKTVKGVTTGGINREQFLVDIVKGRPEFQKRKTDKLALTDQSIMATAKANGLNLAPDQVRAWATRIENGEDEKVIANQIRQIAANGMPDSVKKLMQEGTDLETIYAPYKNIMESVLEVPSNAITLNDATLRSAIGPDKEMSIYEFQRQLRKDARWQYTNNAREEVSNAALGVLRDFGFQG